MADTTKAAKAASEGAAALKVHHLRPAPGARSAKIRVGRGEGGRRGKTAGRGTKGTKARYQVPEGFQGGTTPLHMRFPKLRGFKNPFKTEYQVVNLDWLNAHYPQGGDVSIEDLVAKGRNRWQETRRFPCCPCATGTSTEAMTETTGDLSGWYG